MRHTVGHYGCINILDHSNTLLFDTSSFYIAAFLYCSLCRSTNRCWIITAPSDKVVHLRSTYFDLEDYCLSDSVKVHAGSSSM